MRKSATSSIDLMENRASSLRVISVEVTTTASVEGTSDNPVSTGLKPRTFWRYSEVK